MKPEKTVLLVEDDLDDCSFFQEALAGLSPDINVECLRHTGELCNVIEGTKPFLIVLDYKLTGETGVDCLKRIKKNPICRHIPVVMWSTSNFSRNVEEAYEAGALHYLVKPWHIKVLAAELRKLMVKFLPGELAWSQACPC
ncbi:response regulator [Paraflavisolibacter sp. H34]|uniref:response regulator n=1 Tax=Huijunlia imazamoxiresistens TaxID=3127457 RepID=UPI00301A190B